MKRIATIAAFVTGMTIATAGANAATPAQTPDQVFAQMANTYLILQADLLRAQQDSTALAGRINAYHNATVGSATVNFPPHPAASPVPPLPHPAAPLPNQIVPQPPHLPIPAGPMSRPVGPPPTTGPR
jgi:hypothetical protein